MPALVKDATILMHLFDKVARHEDGIFGITVMPVIISIKSTAEQKIWSGRMIIHVTKTANH